MSGFFVSDLSLHQEIIGHIDRRHPLITELAFTDVGFGVPIVPARFKKWAGAPWVRWAGPRYDTPTDLQSWMLPIAGVAGMLTPSYRWDQIIADTNLAKVILSRGFDFYISQEVGIDALGDHPRLRQAWEAFLVELCRRLYAIRPDVEVLWSPYAWDLWSTVSPPRRNMIQAAVGHLLSNVRKYSQTPGITYVDLQDGRGAQPSEPETDAVNWYKLISSNSLAKYRINMEYFTPHFTAQPPEEMERREKFYKSNDVPIGCCWELRYW